MGNYLDCKKFLILSFFLFQLSTKLLFIVVSKVHTLQKLLMLHKNLSIKRGEIFILLGLIVLKLVSVPL